MKIRLAGLGCKNRVFYRIAAADSHTLRDGKHLQVGFYDPLAVSLFFSYYFHMLSSHEDFFSNFKDLDFEGLLCLFSGSHKIIEYFFPLLFFRIRLDAGVK